MRQTDAMIHDSLGNAMTAASGEAVATYEQAPPGLVGGAPRPEEVAQTLTADAHARAQGQQGEQSRDLARRQAHRPCGPMHRQLAEEPNPDLVQTPTPG